MSRTSFATVKLSVEITGILARTEHEEHHRTCRTLGAGPTPLIPTPVESGTDCGWQEQVLNCDGVIMPDLAHGVIVMLLPTQAANAVWSQCGMEVGEPNVRNFQMWTL